MTKANVLQLGFLLFLIGGCGYGIFIALGFDSGNAGVISEALLILLLLVWLISYFYRVTTGKMTFMEQRKRYLNKYEEITDKELKEKFNSMTNAEKDLLLKDLEVNNNDNKEIY